MQKDIVDRARYFSLLTFIASIVVLVVTPEISLSDEINEIKSDINQIKESIELLGKGNKNGDIESLRREFVEYSKINDTLLKNAFGVTIFGVNANLLAAFVAIITTMGIISNFAYKGIRAAAISEAEQRASEKVDELVSERLISVGEWDKSKILFRVSITYWLYFKTQFRQCIKDGIVDATLLDNVCLHAGIASQLSHDSFRMIDSINRDDLLKDLDDQFSHEKAKILSAHLYFRTVELLCEKQKGKPVSESDRHRLVQLADECYNLTRNRYDDWFEMHDSVARVFQYFGRDDISERSLEIIKKICDGHRPTEKHSPVSVERIRKFKADYSLMADPG